MTLSKIGLVLGAGASRPYQFPTAKDLKQLMMGTVPADLPNLQRIREGTNIQDAPWNVWLRKNHYRSEAESDSFKQQFWESDFDSIDRFVHGQQQYAPIAKYYIALILLACESRAVVVGDWYQKLWQNVVDPGLRDGGTELEIVTFNYDRSLEWYLNRVLRAAHGMKLDELHKVCITHVYGYLGSLEETGYGVFSQAEHASNFINLIPPRIHSNESIRDKLLECDRIVFLGFGFDDLNLDVLGINEENIQRPKNQLYATSFGLSEDVLHRADSRLGRINWSEDLKADDFLHKVRVFT